MTTERVDWDKHIKQCKERGISCKAYCREQQIDYGRFLYRFNKTKQALPVNALIPVSVKDPGPGARILCSLELGNGSALHIHDKHALDAILERVF